MARLTGKDVTVLSAGAEVLATYRSCAIEIARDLVETTGVEDDVRSFADGPYGWSVTFETLKSSAAAFPGLIATGGTAAFACTEAAGGRQYAGAIRFADVASEVGGEVQLERVTALGTGPLEVT
jgi:hypothetical protein